MDVIIICGENVTFLILPIYNTIKVKNTIYLTCEYIQLSHNCISKKYFSS